MNKKYLLVSFILLILSTLQILKAQYQQDNSYYKFVSAIDSIYNADFMLKNGRYYISEYPRAKGNPFFFSEKWIKGQLVLQNKAYENINLLYDINNERVLCIIKGTGTEEIPIRLNNDLITSFQLEDHRFIHSKYRDILPQTGFYEIIFSGNDIQAYFKWKKKYLRIYTTEYLGEFDSQQKSMYLVLNKKAYPVKDNNDFLKLFDKNKKQVKTYLKQHHIKILKSNNTILTNLFQYCEDITKHEQ
jgi:hypothetical protein